MRYIDLSRLRLPPDWEQRALQALADVKSVPEDERASAMQARAHIWQELKAELSKLSHDKCWYCESKRHRTDDAVDHFRPKGRVAGCPGHKGYWWLAFAWQNYRFSCTYCNSRRKDRITRSSGGKQDYFPLMQEKYRAVTECDPTMNESPCLLDPTILTDPGLLWFQEDGAVVPRYPDKPKLKRRAAESIKLYHLGLTETAERRALLFLEIKELVEDGAQYFERYAEGDKTVTHAFQRVLEKLRNLTSPQAEFSSAANAYLRGLRGERREWLDMLLETV